MKQFIEKIIILLLYAHNIYSQEYSGPIEILSFPDTLKSQLNYCNHPDSNFTGIDSTYEYIGGIEYLERLVVSEYEKGKKIKATAYRSKEGGNKYIENNFKNGKLHSFCKDYYENGNIKLIIYYENGEWIYPHIFYYENGNLKDVDNFNTKDSTGWSIGFYENGACEYRLYKNDTIKHGYCTEYYYENGLIKTRGIYNSGKQKWEVFYSNGNRYIEGYMYNVSLCQLGHWTEWYENGIKSSEYFFHDRIWNQPEGIWSWWDEQGNLLMQKIYKNGKLIETKEYVKNIKKKIEDIH